MTAETNFDNYSRRIHMDDWPQSQFDRLAPDVDVDAAYSEFDRRRKRRRRRTRAMAAAVVVFGVVGGIAVVQAIVDGDRPEVIVSSDTTAITQSGPSTEPSASTSPDTTTGSTETTTTIKPQASPRLTVSPFGVSSVDFAVRSYQLDISSKPVPDGGVLTYQLQLGLDLGGRGGVIVAPEQTADEQIAIDASCDAVDCLRVDPNNQEIQTSLRITARYSNADVTTGEHVAPFGLQFDDGSSASFDVLLYAQPAAPTDLAERIATSTGEPEPVQKVFGVGNFAYHAVTAFDSIWIAGRNSGTVARIDAVTGELLATIPVREGVPNSSPSRLAVGSDAIYAAGSPVVRIDPSDNSTTRIDGGTDALGVIADESTVWAADFNGIQRIDPDGTITPLDIEQGRWFDLAVSDGVIWAISQQRVDGRLIGFDGETGAILHEVPLDLGDNEFPVRIVADDTQVVVGTDTTGGGGRAGRIISVNPRDGTILATTQLESRPEGIAFTPTHIWTSGAILDRSDLTVLLDNQSFGFTITIGPDGSIWGTGAISSTAEFVATRWNPGAYRD